MKKPCGFWAVAVVACVAVAAALLPGCKKDPSTDAGQSYFDANPVETLPREDPLPPSLVMSPSSYAVTMAGSREMFTVVGGEEPIQWRVSNNQVGRIEVQANTRQAIYVATQAKNNTVIARDAAGGAAIARITGTDNEALTVLPAGAHELPADGDQIEFFVHGGTRWYSWEIVFEQRGTIVEKTTDGARILYQRTDEGDQTLIVTDSDGRYAEVAISQPAPVPLTLVPSTATLTNNGAVVRFEATGGKPPYTWTVKHDTVGIVWATTGASVVYERIAAGVNQVTVTDSAVPPASQNAVIGN
jgi:hypothetical protein